MWVSETSLVSQVAKLSLTFPHQQHTLPLSFALFRLIVTTQLQERLELQPHPFPSPHRVHRDILARHSCRFFCGKAGVFAHYRPDCRDHLRCDCITINLIRCLISFDWICTYWPAPRVRVVNVRSPSTFGPRCRVYDNPVVELVAGKIAPLPQCAGSQAPDAE